MLGSTILGGLNRIIMPQSDCHNALTRNGLAVGEAASYGTSH